MKMSKKLYTTLIIAVLTLSTVIAAIPMASAEITSDPFLVHPMTGADITSAAVGTPVRIIANATSGRASPFAIVTIYWDSRAGAVLGNTTADYLGDYAITVTIPASTAGDHRLVANDGESESGSALVTVTPKLTVANIPSYGPTLALPGDDLAITGSGYAPNDAITLFLNLTTSPTTSYVITTPAFTTDASGSFSGTITVPAIPESNFGYYEFNATDEATNTAVAYATINYYIATYPASGPTGIQIMIYGRIAANNAYTIRFNGAAIATGTSDGTGSYMQMYTIPAVLSPASYPVDIWWATTETRSTTFNVTATPTISLGASSGVAGDIVTITGADFVGGADITLYFGTTIVNSTTMNAAFGPASYYGGSFSEEFVVPTLTPGVYAVSVVDAWGATSASGVFFTIYPTPLITVETASFEYYQGDLLSLNTWTNVVPGYDVMWEIYEPNGLLFSYGTLYSGDWYMISMNNYEFPYVSFYMGTPADTFIPADATTGVWNFTAYNYGTMAKIDTNLFEVKVKPNMQTVLDAINNCCGNMTALLADIGANITAIDGKLVTITSDIGDLTVDISNLDGKITGIATSSALSSLDSKVSSLSSSIATISTSIGTVQTTLGNLDAVVAYVAEDVVAIKTSVGDLEGTITDIADGVATIETDVGTLKVDVAALKTDVASVQSDVEESLPVAVDMMPVWIAVVLSLIAAIAAIFAVVTIRQKIAG